MINPFYLTGKTILVTGASSGIGYETCKIVAALGGIVIATARSESNLKSLIIELGDGGHTFICADISCASDRTKLLNMIPLIDGLVHSAGIMATVPLKFIKEDIMDAMYNVNYKSIVLLMQELVKNKKIRKGASIVFVSSIAGLVGTKGNGMYAGTKGALISASRVFANELAGQKVRVNCVAPGMVRTAIMTEMSKELSKEVVEADEAKYPLGYGNPEDVANPILFLLSDASKWMTGQTMVLDGGRTCVI